MVDEAAYDVVVVGAGPAGLMAARGLARFGFRTAVLEKQAAPGQLHHPCHGMLAPVPGLIRSEARPDGLYYPELDLAVPRAMILGYPVVQHYLSPEGHGLTALLGYGDGGAIVVDKARLLGRLAEQAAQAGADLQFSNAVTGLLQTGRQVTGVLTTCGPLTASLVLAAEGTSRTLCEAANLYGQGRREAPYAVTVSQELAAPAVAAGDLGYVMTFGRRYSSAPQAYGTVLMSEPGRAAVSFTVLSERPRHPNDLELWSYLDEYVRYDRRVAGPLAGARILSRAGFVRQLGAEPAHLVRDGFLVTGDAVTSCGHLGVLLAMYAGRSAALAAAEALDAGDLSAAALAGYDQMLRGGILPGLQRESRALRQLMRMTDEEINRLFALLIRFHRGAPFLATWSALPWVAARWLVEQAPGLVADYELLQRFLGEPASRAGGEPGSALGWPAQPAWNRSFSAPY